MTVSTRALALALGLGLMVAASATGAAAQSLSIADKITWEEAILAWEDGDWQEALVLFEDVISASGPQPGLLYDAAWIANESEQYEKAETWIRMLLETQDTAYRESDQYDSAFRLAAEIQRSLRPIRDSLIDATPLPFSDSLARIGFARELRDRASGCEWRFDRGGLVVKSNDNSTCTNGRAAATGRVRIELTIEKRGGGRRSAAGIVFGRQDASNYYFLRIHPRWEEAGGDMSLVVVRDGREVASTTAVARDRRNRPLQSWNEKGPWRLALEIRGRRVDWFLDGQSVGTEYLDEEVWGDVMAAASGPDDGEFLFTSFAMDRIAVTEEASR